MREDESTGAVSVGNLRGDALANALMKCETKAKRRVTLSIAGLGWLDETEIETIPQPNLTSSNPDPLPEGQSPSEGPMEIHPTADQPTADEITTLVQSAQAANVSLEDFGHDMRRLMQVPATQKITKKFLRETMTMSQYHAARAHYGEALRQILEQDVPDHPSPSHGGSSASAGGESAAEPASVSTPAEDQAAKDREIVRALALGWGLPEAEIDHVLSHHRDPQKARDILWRAKQQREYKPDPQPSLTAAD
ncbi:MAG: hypothetical protein M3361_19940 [Candidatus Tectomicrobia bacterium]|nr:hypothetical protein [Candidatus Tectomicrobia bacterium]